MIKRLAPVFLTIYLAGLCCGFDPLNLEEDFRLEILVPEENLNSSSLNIYIVEGSDINLIERMILDSISTQHEKLEVEAEGGVEIQTKETRLLDNETNLSALLKGPSLLLVVGGEKSNKITHEIISSGYEINESNKYLNQIKVGRVRLDDDSKGIILWHPVNEKLERKAVEHSPLSGIVEDEYIPVAASGLGVLLISLFNALKAAAEFMALDIGRKRKPFGHTGPSFKGVYLKEVAAVLGASLVLGFAVTWTFAGPTPDFINLLPLNAAICLFAALSHELSHRLIGRFFGIEIEYRFWYMGSFITILTAFMGNAFGIQGFLMEKIDKDIKKWQYALTKLAAPIMSTGIAVVFALFYLKNPDVIYQIIYTTASIWAMAEILPVRGLDGYDIRNWNRIIWLIFFIVISAVYFSVNFIT